MNRKKSKLTTFIILVIGLLIGCGLIFGSLKMNDYNENQAKENDKIVQQEIKDLETEKEELEKEVVSLESKSHKEFMSNGFSEEYYSISNELENKNEEIIEIEGRIFELENDFDDIFDNHSNKFLSSFLFILGIFAIIVTLMITGVSFLAGKAFGMRSYNEYDEVDDSMLSFADITNGKVLKKELFERLEKLLLASSKDDREQIRKQCTKNMAKSYIDEIDLLKKHNQKRVIKDIENVDSKIVDARKNQHATTVTLVQKVKLFDYIVDSNNDVVSGSKTKKQTQAFKLVFVKDQLKNNSVKKCSNCGAVVKEHSSVKCEYCGVLFDDGNYDWYLVSKVKIDEK